MTDRFLPFDGVMLSLGVALLVLALWLARGDGPRWDPAVFFAGALSAAFGKGRLPLSQGPVPAEGWAGEASELEPAYDPKERLAPECSWEDLAAWGPATRAAVTRRLGAVRLVWVEPPPFEIPEIPSTIVDEPDADTIAALLPRPEDRVVLAGHARADALLHLLHGAPALRDRLRAVLLFAPRLDPAWTATHLTHPAFDVEVAREVPYLTLRAGPEADTQTLPEPPLPPTGRRTLAVIDLGVLAPDAVGDPRVGRSLAALFAALA
jgi:hypothetical protein